MTYAGTITLTAVAVLLASACADPSHRPTKPAPLAQLTAALAALCQAEDLARAGNLPEARITFEDEAHGYLHELAASAQGRARAPVGRLLEAKNRVESAFRTHGGGAPPELAARLATLEAATRDVSETLGMPVPRCGGAGG